MGKAPHREGSSPSPSMPDPSGLPQFPPHAQKASSCHSTISPGVQEYKIDHLWLLLPIKVGPMNPSELDPNISWGICKGFDLDCL